MAKPLPSPHSSPSPPMRHIPLQGSCCVLCRFPIWRADRVGAVIGDWSSPSYSQYTRHFQFPQKGGPTMYTKVSGVGGPCHWKLCRSSACHACQAGHDAFLYHVDCFASVGRDVRKLRLRDIWTIGTWTQVLPNTRYQAWPHRGTSLLDEPLAQSEPLTPPTRRMPPELCHIVIDSSQESTLWRLLAACRRVRMMSSLLDDQGAMEIPLASIGFWNRESDVEINQDEACHVRLRIDEFGIKSMERFGGQFYSFPGRDPGDAWYIVEPVANLIGSKLQIKGQFARFNDPRTWKMWDVPNPPLERLAWHRPQQPRTLVRCIHLGGLTGLTAFCREGSLYYVHPHYDCTEEFPRLEQDTIHPIERLRYTKIFFPLSEGERIDSVWLRYRDYSLYSFEDALIFETNLGRTQVLGSHYESPVEGGGAYKLLAGPEANHLFLPHTEQGVPKRNFCAFPTVLDGQAPPLPQRIAKSITPPDGKSFLYLMTAPTQDVRLIRYILRRNICIGMVLEYNDGTLETLGQCHRSWDPDPVVDPSAIHFKNVDGGLLAKCASPTDRTRPPKGSSWKVKRVEGEIRWWFNDNYAAYID